MVTLSLHSFEPLSSHPSPHGNTRLKQATRREEVPDLNKNPAEHGHEKDRGPWEDVVAAVQVGGADHFDVHPAENDERRTNSSR